MAIIITVEPLNEDTFRTSRFGCPLLGVIFYRVCIHEYFRLVLFWEVCPLLECPLLGSVSSFRVSFIGRFVLFWLVLYWEVCPLSECPLLRGLSSFGLSFIGRFVLFRSVLY